MSTRLLIANTAPPIEPAPHSQWQVVGAQNYATLVTAATNTARVEKTKTRSGGTTVQVPAVVAVSEKPLTPGSTWTTSDTIKAVARCREGTTNHDVSSVLSIRIVDEDLSELGVLYAENIVGSGNSQEWAVSLRNQMFPRSATAGAGTALTGGHTVAGPGEYLEVTFGGRVGGSNGSPLVEIGDVIAESDLAHNSTSTTAGRPWIEFSNDFTFYDPIVSEPPAGDATAEGMSPTSTVSGSPIESSPPAGDATAEGEALSRTSFPHGSIIEDATTTEDPLSSGGTWRTASADLGAAARLKAAANRLQRSASGTNASVRSDAAIDAGIQIPSGTLPAVDLSATIAVQPGSAGAFAEIGLALSDDLSATWDGYAVTIGQQGRCAIRKITAGVVTALMDVAPRSGASQGTDRFGVRIASTDDGLSLQAYFYDVAEAAWFPHETPVIDPAPHTGPARVFVRLAGNNSGNNTSSAITDLRVGMAVDSTPPAGEATADGESPATTTPGAGRSSTPPAGEATAEGVSPRYNGSVVIRELTPGQAIASGDEVDDSGAAFAEGEPLDSAVNRPTYIAIGGLRATLAIGPARQLPTVVEVGSLIATIRPGAAEIAQRIKAGSLVARVSAGPINVDPGVLTVPIGSLTGKLEIGGAIVAQRVAIGSLTARLKIGAVTVNLFDRPVVAGVTHRTGTTVTTGGRAGTTTTVTITRN